MVHISFSRFLLFFSFSHSFLFYLKPDIDENDQMTDAVDEAEVRQLIDWHLEECAWKVVGTLNALNRKGMYGYALFFGFSRILHRQICSNPKTWFTAK